MCTNKYLLLLLVTVFAVLAMATDTHNCQAAQSKKTAVYVTNLIKGKVAYVTIRVDGETYYKKQACQYHKGVSVTHIPVGSKVVVKVKWKQQVQKVSFDASDQTERISIEKDGRRLLLQRADTN